MREIIKLVEDRPIVVKLDFGPEGIERTGKFGPQYQYTLNDDRAVMWTTPDCREAIMSSGAQAGDEIVIVKQGRMFDVKLYDGEELPEPPPPPRRAVATPKNEPAPAPTSTRSRHFREEAATRRRPAASAATVQVDPASPEYVFPLMSRCMRAACDILLDAAAYGESIGLQIDRPTLEDVRATAFTLFIDRRKR